MIGLPGLRQRWRSAAQVEELDRVVTRLDEAAVAVSEEIRLMSEADAGLRELEQRVLATAERRLGRES